MGHTFNEWEKIQEQDCVRRTKWGRCCRSVSQEASGSQRGHNLPLPTELSNEQMYCFFCSSSCLEALVKKSIYGGPFFLLLLLRCAAHKECAQTHTLSLPPSKNGKPSASCESLHMMVPFRFHYSYRLLHAQTKGIICLFSTAHKALRLTKKK